MFDASGTLLGIATAAQIRGYAVVIPASIAWAAAAQLLVSGTPRRGFIGVAVQAVELPQSQRADGRERALLVVGVTPSGPAESAGVNVGDLILEVDGKPLASSEELLDHLGGRKAGETIVLSTLRGGTARDVFIVVGERPSLRRSRRGTAFRVMIPKSPEGCINPYRGTEVPRCASEDPMKVVLVGPSSPPRSTAPSVPEPLEVVGEADTLAEARRWAMWMATLSLPRRPIRTRPWSSQ